MDRFKKISTSVNPIFIRFYGACLRQEVSGNRNSQNIWQKIYAYHKLTTRISGYFLPKTSSMKGNGTTSSANPPYSSMDVNDENDRGFESRC